MHKFISINEAGRDFVVGDIHGCYKMLKDALKYEGFDKNRDRLFSVGDIIDRGPKSEKCLSLLDEPWFHMVLGNHERMMIDAVLHGEGYNWSAEYGVWANRLSHKEREYWAHRLSEIPISMTVQHDEFTFGICHAEPDGLNWKVTRDNNESIPLMLWGRRVLRGQDNGFVEGIDFTVHGHTPLELPKWIGNRYFMDTGAWYSDVLTLRKVENVYQEYKNKRSLFGETK